MSAKNAAILLPFNKDSHLPDHGRWTKESFQLSSRDDLSFERDHKRHLSLINKIKHSDGIAGVGSGKHSPCLALNIARIIAYILDWPKGSFWSWYCHNTVRGDLVESGYSQLKHPNAIERSKKRSVWYHSTESDRYIEKEIFTGFNLDWYKP